jgi:AcrR family transcriptional regulator
MATNAGKGRARAHREPATSEPEVAVGEPASKRALRSQGRETMRRLLDAAMEAIDERGYHSTRVKDVVDIANTSHGTFYLYFSNKEDLVRALTIEATSEASRLYGAVTEAGNALDIESWDNLRQWIGDYSALWSRYAPLFRSWIDLATVDRAVVDQTRTMVAAHIDAMASRISSSGPTGDLDPGVAGLAVIAMLDRFHLMSEFMGTPVDDAALDTLTTMVHRALFPAVNGRHSC